MVFEVFGFFGCATDERVTNNAVHVFGLRF